jgi:hypothetical protein
VIGINQNLWVVIVHQVGTRERKLEEMIRIAAGADLELEISKVDMGLGMDEGEEGVKNLVILMAKMTTEAGRVRGVVTMLEDHPGGPITRSTMKVEILVVIGKGVEVGGNMEGEEEAMVGEMVIETTLGLEEKVTVVMNQSGETVILLI